MEADGCEESLLEDEICVDDANGMKRVGSELEAFPRECKGREQEEGHDGDDGKEIDVVQGPLQNCYHSFQQLKHS